MERVEDYPERVTTRQIGEIGELLIGKYLHRKTVNRARLRGRLVPISYEWESPQARARGGSPTYIYNKTEVVRWICKQYTSAGK